MRRERSTFKSARHFRNGVSRTLNQAIVELKTGNYLGISTFSKKLEYYHLSLTHHKENFLIPIHHHQNPYISLNLGSYYLEIEENSKKIINPGQILYRPSYYKHQNTFPKNNGICFNIEQIGADSETDKAFSTAVDRLSPFSIIKLLTSLIKGFQDDELSCLTSEILFSQTGNSLNIKYPKWYKIILDKINEDYSENLSLKKLAEIAGVHPNYLARKFRSIKGLTLGEYIRKVRIENATINIFSGKKLTNVALDNGYYDQAHFTKAFEANFGSSPKKFQSLVKG